MELPGSNASRRRFLKAVLAVGGASALSACVDRFGDEPIPQGTDDQTVLPDRQFAWNDSLDRDDHGNVVLPEHHLFLYLTYDGEAGDEEVPTTADRETLEAGLRTIERAFEWSNRGAVFELSYSPSYFDRFAEPLPDSVDLPPPRRLSQIDTPALDQQDALLHLASDRSDALLEIEETLLATSDTGEPTLNGVSVEGFLGDVFRVDEPVDRRTGFIGPGLPAANQGVGGIPEDGPVPEKAPLFMGFKAAFAGNQATEDCVTISEGPFAGGTTKHVAAFRQQLDKWYGENSHEEMVSKMFSPRLSEDEAVEGVGENLGNDSGITKEIFDQISETASEFGVVGHAEKAARANRDEEGNVRLLRRHVESTDNGNASLHFPSLQQGIGEFEAVQEAMNGRDLTDHPAIQPRVKNGILRYIFAERRGNFLVPPRSLRAFPTSTGEIPETPAGETPASE